MASLAVHKDLSTLAMPSCDERHSALVVRQFGFFVVLFRAQERKPGQDTPPALVETNGDRLQEASKYVLPGHFQDAAKVADSGTHTIFGTVAPIISPVQASNLVIARWLQASLRPLIFVDFDNSHNALFHAQVWKKTRTMRGGLNQCPSAFYSWRRGFLQFRQQQDESKCAK